MTPNEKTTEMLFNRYFLQSFRLGQVVLYAPSSREEYEKGYDARLTGIPQFREVLLQFKRPKVLKGGFRISLTPHQHTNLRRRPSGSSFYVGHTFANLKELEAAQKNAAASREFLKHFILISVDALAEDACHVFYERGATDLARSVSVQRGNGEGSLTETIPSRFYSLGGSFVKAFQNREVGRDVHLPEGELFRHAEDMRLGLGLAVCAAETDDDVRECQPVWVPTGDEMHGMSAIGAEQHGTKGGFPALYRV